MNNPKLFSAFQLRGLAFKNRIFVSPMCQYSSKDGMADAWHLVHLGSRAIGGAALVMTEATAVTDIGRISPGDLGIWNDRQRDALAPIAKFIAEQGAVPAIQLAHSGRKGSTQAPWDGDSRIDPKDGGWTPVAPSALPFKENYPTPRELRAEEMETVVADFVAAAKRAETAGFQVVELHMAHGYLLHEFLSPLSNRRTDLYGGSLENRMRLPLRVASAVRAAWPAKWPVFVRISATDWAPEGGWDLPQSIELAKALKKIGIDLVDCSTGGTLPDAKIAVGPAYQVEFSAAVRKEAGIATSAVGVIVNATQAETILRENLADVVSIAREFLRDPYFPLHAAKELGADVPWPKQYARAKR